MIALAEKCDHLQDYNSQLENQVTPFQTQVAELQKELGSFFKSIVSLKKKNDDLNVALSTVHSKLWQESSLHSDKVKRTILRPSFCKD